MKIVLELLDQTSSVRKITVRHDIVIGRGSECNLRLSAPQVSRRHCFLRVGRDGISITDLDSSNGTWVNGARIPPGTRKELADGAQLSLGPVRFLLHVRPEARANDPPSAISPHDGLSRAVSEDTTCAPPIPATPATQNASLQTMAAYPQPAWQADDSRAEIIELGRQLVNDSSHSDHTILNPQLSPLRSAKDRLDSATTSPDLDLSALGALENADVLDPNVLAGKFPPDRPMWSRDFSPSPEIAQPEEPQEFEVADAASDFDAGHPDAELLSSDYPDADLDPVPENDSPESAKADDDFGPELSAFLKGL